MSIIVNLSGIEIICRANTFVICKRICKCILPQSLLYLSTSEFWQWFIHAIYTNIKILIRNISDIYKIFDISDISDIWNWLLSCSNFDDLDGVYFSFPTKKWSFQLMISSVNVTKSTVSCIFGNIYWKNP